IRDIEDKYLNNTPILPEDQKEMERLTVKMDAHRAVLESMEPEFKEVSNTYFRLLKVITPAELSMGWQEDEADELGFFLYLKSGFYASGFYEALFRSMNQEAQNECETKYLSQINVPGHVP